MLHVKMLQSGSGGSPECFCDWKSGAALSDTFLEPGPAWGPGWGGGDRAWVAAGWGNNDGPAMAGSKLGIKIDLKVFPNKIWLGMGAHGGL